MKKIVVFSVLLALLSAAVFAQDDSGWKVGFYSQLTRDFFYTTKTSGESETKTSTSPSDPADGTYTGKLGDYIKGSSNMWTHTGIGTPDQRLLVSLSNSGDHHKVYIDAKLDGTWFGGPKFIDLISGGAADWEFSGDTGASGAPVVFDGKVGSGRYGGFVPAYEVWNDWIQSAGQNFFGVEKYQSGFQPSNNISTADVDGSVWGAVYALGATFGNFKLAIGSTLDSFATGVDNSVASASKVTGAFILSGKELGPLAFDLFYGVNGGDNNTAIRGTGKWENLLGAYVGLNLVENLGLSIGYTANFTKYETGQTNKETDTSKKPNYVTYETESPIWSGVDIKVKFSGIEKLDITFNNNISFASASGAEVKNPGDTVVLGLDGKALGLGGDAATGKINTNTQNWFAYTAVLEVGFSLTDNLGLKLALLDKLTVYSAEKDTTTTVGPVTTTSNEKGTLTSNDLRTALTASYGVGNVSFGLGIQFWMNTDSREGESKISTSGGGASGSSETTGKGSLSTVQFAVPIFFKVSI